jgi:hypothetical protein
MRAFTCLLPLATLMLVAPPLAAQTARGPAGHWDGALHIPAYQENAARDVAFAVDLAKDNGGTLAGTFTQPAENVHGLPLSTVTSEGPTITFAITATSGGGVFHGTLGDDGRSMSGTFTTAEGGYDVPFTLTRTGEANIAPAPKSAPITKALEGTWNGALIVGGKTVRLVLLMANRPDGTATGTVRSGTAGSPDIPIAIAQDASSVTIGVPSVGSSFAGVLNAAGTELAGTWTQGTLTLPLTLRHGDR